MLKYIFILILVLPSIVYSETLDLNTCNYVASTKELLQILNHNAVYKNKQTSGLLCYKSNDTIFSDNIEPEDVILLPIVNGYPNGIERRYAFSYHGSIKIISSTSIQVMTIQGMRDNYELKNEVIWKNGKREGIEKYYSGANVSHEIPWKDGRKDGIEKIYRYGNQVWGETPWKNGKREGVSKEYNEYGIIFREITWKNNMQNGVTKRYYDNGKLEVETPYVNGREHGIEKWYDESGVLEDQIEYRNGIELY